MLFLYKCIIINPDTTSILFIIVSWHIVSQNLTSISSLTTKVVGIASSMLHEFVKFMRPSWPTFSISRGIGSQLPLSDNYLYNLLHALPTKFNEIR